MSSFEHQLKFSRRITNVELAAGVSADVTAQPLSLPATSATQDHRDMATETEKGIGELIAAIVTATEKLQLDSDHIVNEVTSLSVNLSRIIVQNIIGSSEAIQEQRLTNLIRQTLSQTTGAPHALGIHVHPSRIKKIESELHLGGVETNVAIESDESLDAMECRVAYPTHELVSSLEWQLDQIEKNLMEVLNEA